MSINGIIGEQVSYEGLAVGILNEAEGSYRIVIDRASEFSSSCAGYTQRGYESERWNSLMVPRLLPVAVTRF